MAILVVDNHSPFTGDILQCLEKMGARYACKKYSEIPEIKAEWPEYEKVILSGRQENHRLINAINSRIVKHCFETDRPLLGICYGAEITALTMGGSIKRMPSGHVRGMTSVQVAATTPIMPEKRRLDVYESHGFCVARLPGDFITVASSASCQYEIFAHRKKSIYGTQFHPEKSGTDGMDILSNFVAL